jgi:hypothetical protein
MLDNISSGKRLPEKSLLVLGEDAACACSGEKLIVRQVARQRHSGTSWSQFRQSPTAGGRQTGAGSRPSPTSLRWATRTKTCSTLTMRVCEKIQSWIFA